MYAKVKNALLICNDTKLCNLYHSVAMEAGVNLRIEDYWDSFYRVNEDVIICTSQFLDSINKAFYPKVVVLLGSKEKPFTFMKRDVTRFIFNAENRNELYFAFFTFNKELIEEIDFVNSCSEVFEKGNYRFLFGLHKYYYKGKLIYLCKHQQRYIYRWLMKGEKDVSKRAVLCAMRKKYGKDFLSEFGRHGEWKEGEGDE